jgi:hypothetical protein
MWFLHFYMVMTGFPKAASSYMHGVPTALVWTTFGGFFFIVCSGFLNTIHVAYSGFRKSFYEAPAGFEILFNQQEMSIAPAAVGKTQGV